VSEADEIEDITNAAGTGAVDFPEGLTVAGSAVNIVGVKHTTSTTAPSNPSNGDTWYNPNGYLYYVRINNEWKAWLGSPPSTLYWAGNRGLIPGGKNNTSNFHTYFVKSIDYIDITTAANAADFGNLVIYSYYDGNYLRQKGRRDLASVSDTTKGVMACGAVGTSNNSGLEYVDYITFATPSNATSQGDLAWKRWRAQSVSNGTRGVFWSGYYGASEYLNRNTNGWPYGEQVGSSLNNMIYITIATNATAESVFGTCLTRIQGAGCSNGTYGVAAGGTGAGPQATDDMEYITIATTGNATSFGSLTSQSMNGCTGTSNETRAVWWGTSSNANNATLNVNIHYLDIATLGDGADFGDMSTRHAAACSIANETRACIAGGFIWTGSSSAFTNSIEYITLATTGNSQDFGDLIGAKAYMYDSGLSGNAA
tara:strand:+ start:702 stop:1979 length:1278 start_codon:yes stop_codon:yes gene_type:complete